jgi:hypothetical protein
VEQAYTRAVIAIILETAGCSSKLSYCFGRQGIEAVASIEPHYRNAALGTEPLFDADEVRQLGLPVLCSLFSSWSAGAIFGLQATTPACVRSDSPATTTESLHGIWPLLVSPITSPSFQSP